MEEQHNIDKLPGYPHYPAKDDITRAKNNSGRERLDDEDRSSPEGTNYADDVQDTEVTINPGTDADVSAEDIRMLQAAEQNMDSNDSVNLQKTSLDSVDDEGDTLNEDGSLNMDMTGEDLDVPGSGEDDADEDLGEEDEENNYYSLGGDLHESQEESKGD
jgi:hypothetical protein